MRDLAIHWMLRLRRSVGDVEIRVVPDPELDGGLDEHDLPTAEYCVLVLDEERR